MTAAPRRHDEHDLNVSSDYVREIVPITALALDPEQSAPSEDGKLNLTTEVADPVALEPNTDLTSNEDCVIGTSDSSLAIGSEPRVSAPIGSDRAPILEFSSADIFQHSPLGDVLNSLKSLSLSGDSWPNYVQLEWEANDEELRCPPTTHLIGTVYDMTDMLDFDSEDVDGMDDDAEEEQEPTPTGR